MSIWYTQEFTDNNKEGSDKEHEIDVFGQLYEIEATKSRKEKIIENIRNVIMSHNYISITHLCAMITTDFRTNIIRIILITVAVIILLSESTRHNYKDNSSDGELGVLIADMFINLCFIFDAFVRLLSIPMFIRVEYAFGREVNGLNLLWKSGSIRDIVIVILCLSYGISMTGLWLRLILLISLVPSFIEVVPKLSILLSSITKALKSIFITIALFFLSILIYASFGHILFSRNDPYHFGNYGLSLWSFFHMAVFDNWTEIWSINYFGCNKYPADNITIITSSNNNLTVDSEIITKYGTFQLGMCTTPETSPILSTIVFLSFVLISAYVLVNTVMAAVVIGIKGGLDIYKNMELLGEEHRIVIQESLVDDVVAKHNSNSSAARRATGINNTLNSKVLKMTGGNKDAENMKRTLLKIWAGDSKTLHKKSNLEAIYGSWTNSNRIVAEYELFMQSNIYMTLYIFSSVIVAILQILLELTILTRIEAFPAFILFQILFSIDMIMRLFTYLKRNPKEKSDW